MIIRDLKSFFRPWPSTVGALLLHGPDRGKIRDWVDIVTKHFLKSPVTLGGTAKGTSGGTLGGMNQEMNRSILNGKDVRLKPGLLIEELAKTSLLDEKRVLFIDESTDGSCGSWRQLIQQPSFPYAHSFAIAAAGSLKTSSSLRRLFEKTPSLVSFACYAADARQSQEGLRAFCERAGYHITPDASAAAAALFSEDSALNRREMEKLLLYAGSHSTIDEDDVIACLADNDQNSLDSIAFCVGEGDVAQLDRRLSKALGSGVSPIAVLRVGIIHFLRIFQAADDCTRGRAGGEALARLKPPVFFRRRPSFLRQLKLWNPDQAMMAVQRLLRGEITAKREGLAEMECRQCLFFLADYVRR